jgi:hypothetical protein
MARADGNIAPSRLSFAEAKSLSVEMYMYSLVLKKDKDVSVYVYVTLCGLACILCVSSVSSQRFCAMISNPQKMHNKIEIHIESESWIRGLCFQVQHAKRRIWQANP